MTASQMKRIRARLERARILTAEAHELARKGSGPYGLTEVTARAADDMESARRRLEHWDARNRQHAEAVARQLREEAGMTEAEKQVHRKREAGWSV